MIKTYFSILFIISFSSLLFSQSRKTEEPEKIQSEKKNEIDQTESTGDKITVKDGSTVLLEFVNEGAAGSYSL